MMSAESEAMIKSIYWGQIYNNTVEGCVWLKDKSVSAGRWAVGYEYLFVLYRALNDFKPKSILELGLGQSTKLTSQYAAHYKAYHKVIEHDEEWKKYFLSHFNAPQNLNVSILNLAQKGDEKNNYYEYEDFSKEIGNDTFDLISVDGPFGGKGNLSRRDILPLLPGILKDDFVIMIDDCGRLGEIKTAQDILKILQDNGIEFATGLYDGGGTKRTVVITSKSYKWLTSL